MRYESQHLPQGESKQLFEKCRKGADHIKHRLDRILVSHGGNLPYARGERASRNRVWNGFSGRHEEIVCAKFRAMADGAAPARSR